jgi:uncharacterized protein
MQWLQRLFVALIALVAVSIPTGGFAQNETDASTELRVPQLQGRVNDYANILTPMQEAALTRRLEAIESETPLHDQVVILTMSDLRGNDVQEFANRIGREWRIGQREHNNGVIVLLSLNNPRIIRFETAGGTQDRLTDGRGWRIQNRQMLPHLTTDTPNYFAALDVGIQGIHAALMGRPMGSESAAPGTQVTQEVWVPRTQLEPRIPSDVTAAIIIGGLITLLIGFANGWFSPVTGAATGAVAAGLWSAFALTPFLLLSAGIGLVVGAVIGLLAYGMRVGAIDPALIFALLSGGGGGGSGGGFGGGGGGDWSGGGSDTRF